MAGEVREWREGRCRTERRMGRVLRVSGNTPEGKHLDLRGSTRGNGTLACEIFVANTQPPSARRGIEAGNTTAKVVSVVLHDLSITPRNTNTGRTNKRCVSCKGMNKWEI